MVRVRRYVGAPCSFADVAVVGTVFDTPEFASGVFVGDGGVHWWLLLEMMAARVSRVSASIVQAAIVIVVVGRKSR
ncbi:hypothetical protein [Corynebacterium pseudotuberculosis]|uniref:hypothetical protein n=1 Tax=Corynebacterium pseudotuberculosis TaxID=1719 RepID=UPI0012FE227D